MIRRLFSGQTTTITAAAMILGAASLVSRILGMLRDRVLAAEFGAGVELDMYYTAFRVPDLLFNVVVLGALSAGFIPVFAGYLKSPKRAWELVNVVLNVMVVALLMISALLMVLAPWLVRIIAPGFSIEQIAITATLTRIMLISPMLLGMSGIFGSVLQSHKRFFVYALAPILYNIGIIIGALFFIGSLGITGLAWGVVLGAFFHMAVQLVAMLPLGYRYQWRFDLTHKGLQKIFSLMVPRTLGLITSQINFLVITIIGSTLAAGSIAIFNFANNIQSFPLGLFGVSFAIAVFPTLSELIDKKKEFIETFSQAVRQILFLVIPASVLLIVLRAQVVRVVLGSGRFNWEDTVLTLETLSFFALSLFAQALILVLARAFYAFHDSKTPFYTGLATTFANIILSLMLLEPFGVAGLALAFSMSTMLNFILLILLLHYRLGKLDGHTISVSTVKIIVASFLLALVAQAVKYPLEQLTGTETLLGVLTQAMTAIIAGSLTYLFAMWLLKSEELTIFAKSFKKKFTKRPPLAEAILEQQQ